MPYKSKAALRKYQRQWVAERRAEYFKDKSCEICGSTDRLELDHRDRREKVSHHIWSWSTPRREAELAKCRPLCHSCHVAKSVASGDFRPVSSLL